MADTTEPRGGSPSYVVLLTMVAALGGLLFGFDTGVISGTIGFLTARFDLDPGFGKGWAAASVLLGCAAGAALAGVLSDRLGRKRVLMVAGFLFFVSALGTALPRDVGSFVLFRILAGVAIGAASISSPMYIAEVSPARVRGKMVSINQFAIVSGILVAYFVNFFIGAYGTARDKAAVAAGIALHGPALEPQRVRDFLQRHFAPQYADYRVARYRDQGEPGWEKRLPRKTVEARAKKFLNGQIEEFLAHPPQPLGSRAVAEFAAAQTGGKLLLDPIEADLYNQGLKSWNVLWGWRWMFGSAAVPAVLLMGLLVLVPESPRWLTKQANPRKAEEILARIHGPEMARTELAAIQLAIAEESGSLGQLLQPGMRTALLIGITLAVLQQITGINVFLYFAPEIFKKMGSGVYAALLQTVVVGAVNVTFTLVAIRTVDRLGRKPLMLAGSAGMGLALLGMAAAAYWRQTDVWVLLFILGYIACFALSVGPVTWVILSEIFPTRIRGRAMAIATVCLWLADFVVTQTFPMMDENPWLIDLFHRAFPFLLYAALCGLAVLFVWRMVPETKGKSLEQIERSWKKG
ncbi:MAG: sugar porter family MFS transporter [Thermoguttaceae bacterium]